MGRNTTFGRKLGFGFAVAALLTVVMSVLGVQSLTQVVSSKDEIIDVGLGSLLQARTLEVHAEETVAATRGYLLTGQDEYLQRHREASQQFGATLDALSKQLRGFDAELEQVRTARQAYGLVAQELVSLDRGAGLPEVVAATFERAVPKRRELSAAVDTLVSRVRSQLTDRAAQESAAARHSVNLLIALGVLAALVSAGLAFALTRHLDAQIATAVGQVQSSSAELQAAASQQATGSREQSTAMSEISTTISELLATSRQIESSSQRVMEMAEATAESARTGDDIVISTQGTVAAIRQHVDNVVKHMLDLGRRSQQIGTVVDIVAELADQTNILAINATIEASGAGESGRRFAVVADEIRKLADRVSGSTKEIRGLIDEVRSAVNTTVMATETSSKAVDAGARQFDQVTHSFQRISQLVETTTESAREIHLSTKQQATAVEQVNVAIASVAQASKETETSSTQTLQTASQLAQLSRSLLRLVRPQATA